MAILMDMIPNRPIWKVMKPTTSHPLRKKSIRSLISYLKKKKVIGDVISISNIRGEERVYGTTRHKQTIFFVTIIGKYLNFPPVRRTEVKAGRWSIEISEYTDQSKIEKDIRTVALKYFSIYPNQMAVFIKPIFRQRFCLSFLKIMEKYGNLIKFLLSYIMAILFICAILLPYQLVLISLLLITFLYFSIRLLEHFLPINRTEEIVYIDERG